MPRLAEIRKELSAARACTDSIFSLFQPETLYERPISERHRVIFYVGHLETFDWNQICRWTLGQSSFHDTFDSLFEAGIDPEVGSKQEDMPSDWPLLEEIRRYNVRARESVDEALENAPETVLRMAIEHRWMHAETTAYLLHHVARSGKLAPPLSPLSEGPPPNHAMIDVPQGVATLGRCDGFGWDNEFGEQQADVPAFAISKYKITNQQYKEFVEQGGAHPPVLGQTRRSLVPVDDVRRNSAPPALARLCVPEPRAGLCAMGRPLASDRSAISSGGVRHAERRRARLSLGRPDHQRRTWEFSLPVLGSHPGHGQSAR